MHDLSVCLRDCSVGVGTAKLPYNNCHSIMERNVHRDEVDGAPTRESRKRMRM